MDDSVQKSCWGVTAKAVACIAGLRLLVGLVGGSGTATTAGLATVN